MAEGRYPEKRIQLAMTAWLQSNSGYVELFGDVEAKGARIDSAGFIKKRLVLIEYKVAVSTSIVDHKPDRPMSLESKFAGALRSLYDNVNQAPWGALNREWDRASPPLLGVAAASYSADALDALVNMLSRRRSDWCFDYVIWRWSGSKVQTLREAYSSGTLPDAGRYANIVVPALVGRRPRQSARTLTELRELAALSGNVTLFDHFVGLVRAAGLKVKTGRWVASALRGGDVICAVYLGGAQQPARSLQVGIVSEFFKPEVARLGFAGRSVGFLNTNRELGSIDDVDQLFAALIPAE